MTYSSGTVNDADPGPALHTALASVLTTAGFTLEDTVVISSRTHKVWSATATNGLTWYLDIHYPTTGNGTIFFCVFEDYNAGTDTAYRGPYTASNSTIDGTTFSRYGATGYALETNWANTTSYTSLDTDLSTSSFAYWFSATVDRVIFMASTDAAKLNYAGMFAPSAAHAAHAGADLFPLIVAKLDPGSGSSSNSTPSSATASLTRVPKLATVSWNNQSSVRHNSNQMEGRAGTEDSPVSGRSVVMPMTVVFSTSSAVAGFMAAGELIDIASGGGASGATRGDTVTIGGDTWIATTPAPERCLFFKAA